MAASIVLFNLGTLVLEGVCLARTHALVSFVSGVTSNNPLIATDLFICLQQINAMGPISPKCQMQCLMQITPVVCTQAKPANLSAQSSSNPS